MTENTKRLVATVPPDTFAVLDALADGARFAGNRSAALAWCVRIGATVLNDASVSDRLFASPDDAMTAFLGAAGRRLGRAVGGAERR